MRKIISQEEKSKKDKRNQIIIGGLLVLVMLFSVLGYSFGTSDEETSNLNAVYYENYKFLKSNGIWKIDLYGKEIYFNNFPNETIFSNQINLLNQYQNLPLYLYSNNSNVDLEIYRTLGQFVQRMQKACPENKTCEQDFPTKNCENNFIIVQESENSEIRQENKCVFVEGKKEDLLRITDEFLFKVFSIK